MTSDQAVGAPPQIGAEADVRPYIVKTYDRWIILVIVLVGGWFLFRPLFAFSVYYRGLSFEHLPALQIAEHYYRKAIGVDARIPEGWAGLGELQTMDARVDHARYLDAIATYQKGLSYNPTSGVLAWDLCRTSYEIGKDYTLALNACELATRNWPANAFAWDYAGWANLRLGHKDKARAFWHEAVRHGHSRAQEFIDRFAPGP